MKKGILALTIGLIGFNSQSQDSTSFFAEQGDGIGILKRYINVDINPGADLQLNDSWTIEAMVRLPQGYSSDQIFIVEAYTGGTANGGYVLRISNKRLQAYAMSSSTLTSVNGTAIIPEDEWTHISASYNEVSGDLSLYINGQLDAEQQLGLDQHCNLTTMRIGARGDDANVNQAALIDEVRIYNIYKDTVSVQTTMNECLLGDEFGLVAYYTFENESGGTITDQTLNGFDGVIINDIAAGSFQNGAYTCPLNASILETTSASVSIYPNPAISELTIESDYMVESVSIFNLDGSLLQTQENTTLSIANLSSGIYILNVVTQNGMVQKRFAKQ